MGKRNIYAVYISFIILVCILLGWQRIPVPKSAMIAQAGYAARPILSGAGIFRRGRFDAGQLSRMLTP